MSTFKFVGNTTKTLTQLKHEGIVGFKLCDIAHDIHGKILPGFKSLYISSNSNYDFIRENQLKLIRSK